ncbi:unnamed protein product [Moneuplotes crassus]|uniref:Uncharacterized protein n=1 Tax=Euplotes crassus TaxID=5936 RepID=A0AAD1UAQ4_EUPCR|nr:unnamed protein product [Moneuplotes crassus]
MDNFWIWSKRQVNSIDMFSKPISLTFQGKHNFASFFGGVVTMGLMAFLLIYGIFLSIQMFTRSATNKSKNSIKRDQISVSDYYDFGYDDLSFAILMEDEINYTPFIDPTYLNMSTILLEYSFDLTTGYFSRKEVEENMHVCNENFPKVNDELTAFRQFFMSTSYCPVQTNFSVGGSIFFNTYKTVRVIIKKCVNGTSVVCKPNTEIEAKLKDLRANFMISSKYFDFEDYDNPIKRVVDDKFSFRLSSGLKKFISLYVKKSTISLSDSILPFGAEIQDSFYSIEDNQEDAQTREIDDQILIDFEISQDSIVDSYERRVYSILDLSGQLGGFFEVLAIFGGALVHYFASQMCSYSLFSQLYCLDEADTHTTNDKSQVAPKSSKKDKGTIITKLNEKEQTLLQTIESRINSKRRFHFTAKDYFKTLVPCFKTRARSEFTVLSDKLADECDLISVVCSIRHLKTLMKLTLSEHQALMMDFDCRSNYLHKGSTDDLFTKPSDFPSTTQEPSKNVKTKISTLLKKLQNLDHDKLEKDAGIILGIPPKSCPPVDQIEGSTLFCRNRTLDHKKEESIVGFLEEDKDNSENLKQEEFYEDSED